MQYIIPYNTSRCLSYQRIITTTKFESTQTKKNLTYITKCVVKVSMLFTY